MSLRRRSSRALLSASVAALACVAAAPLLLVAVAACNKPPTATAFDAGPPPVATDAAPTQIAPMDEDAGSTVDAALPPVHHAGGSGLTTNQARARQCCTALRAAGKSDPMLSAFAAQCDMVAMQMGPTATGGQAPEFAGIRQLLKGHNIPAVCSGL
jgi:hypothetical protein